MYGRGNPQNHVLFPLGISIKVSGVVLAILWKNVSLVHNAYKKKGEKMNYKDNVVFLVKRWPEYAVMPYYVYASDGHSNDKFIITTNGSFRDVLSSIIGHFFGGDFKYSTCCMKAIADCFNKIDDEETICGISLREKIDEHRRPENLQCERSFRKYFPL